MVEHQRKYQSPLIVTLVGSVVGWLLSSSVVGLLVFDLNASEQKKMGYTNTASERELNDKTEKLEKELKEKELQLERLTIRTDALRELKRGEARWIKFGDSREKGRNDGPNPSLSGTFLKLEKIFPAQKAMIGATRKKVNNLQDRIVASGQSQQIRQLKELGTKELSELAVVLSRVP